MDGRFGERRAGWFLGLCYLLGATAPLAALASLLERPVFPAASIAALVWYPFSQAHTLLAALGIDPHDPAFLEAQRRQITEVLLAAMGARNAVGDELA